MRTRARQRQTICAFINKDSKKFVKRGSLNFRIDGVTCTLILVVLCILRGGPNSVLASDQNGAPASSSNSASISASTSQQNESQAPEFLEVENGYRRTPREPAKIKISVIDSATAERHFQKWAHDSSLPFLYLKEGCFARATEMARMAEKEHIFVGKINIEGKLQLTLNEPEGSYQTWGWHVAPVVFVKREHGPPELKVLDPGISSGPLTVDEWIGRMRIDTSKYTTRMDALYYGSRFQRGTKDVEATKEAWDEVDLDVTRMRLEENRRIEAMMRGSKMGPPPLAEGPSSGEGRDQWGH